MKALSRSIAAALAPTLCAASLQANAEPAPQINLNVPPSSARTLQSRMSIGSPFDSSSTDPAATVGLGVLIGIGVTIGTGYLLLMQLQRMDGRRH